jgi:hypothetical protein
MNSALLRISPRRFLAFDSNSALLRISPRRFLAFDSSRHHFNVRGLANG